MDSSLFHILNLHDFVYNMRKYQIRWYKIIINIDKNYVFFLTSLQENYKVNKSSTITYENKNSVWDNAHKQEIVEQIRWFYINKRIQTNTSTCCLLFE